MILSTEKLGHLNKNIMLSVLIKAFNIVFVILIVRRSIDVLGVEEYGIWTAIASIATWVSLLDIGIGNGLRVELRRCFLAEDWKQARVLINTAYLFVALFSVIVLIGFSILWVNIDWVAFFNIKNYAVQNINLLVLVTMIGLILQLIFSLIQPVLNANLDSGFQGIFFAISNALILCYLLIVQDHHIDILQYALLSAFLPVFAYIGFSLFYFTKYLPQLKPNFRATNFKKIGSILLVSGKFFFIQISAVLMYQMTSFLIIRYFSPIEVIEYTVAFRYFNLFYIVFITVLSPVWSLSTDAYLRKDFEWITMTIKKYVLVLILVILALVFGYFVRDLAFRIWLNNVSVSPKIAMYVAIYMGILSWNNIFLYVVNGTGKIHFQFILSIITTIIFFPLTHFLVKTMNWGIDGIFISNMIILSMFSLFIPLQTYFLLKTNRQGIWNK
jgi:O-antigen/teichoic acid export membrane protein